LDSSSIDLGIDHNVIDCRI